MIGRLCYFCCLGGGLRSPSTFLVMIGTTVANSALATQAQSGAWLRSKAKANLGVTIGLGIFGLQTYFWLTDVI